MSQERLTLHEEKDRELQKIRVWHAQQVQKRTSGDKGEYILHTQKPQVLELLSPQLLSKIFGVIPITREDYPVNGKGPSILYKEIFRTILDNTTYEVRYSRDFRGILQPKEIKLVYTSPENK